MQRLDHFKDCSNGDGSKSDEQWPENYIDHFSILTSVLSCHFWERTLHLDAMIRAKNQAQRSRTLGAGSALTALIGGA